MAQNQPQLITPRPAFSGFQRFMNGVFVLLMCLDFFISGFGYVNYTENAIQSMVIFESDPVTTPGSTKIVGILSLLLTQLGWIYMVLGILGFLALFFKRRSMLLFVMSLVMIITTSVKIHYITKNNPHDTLSSELQEIVKFEVVQLVIGLLVAFISYIERGRNDLPVNVEAEKKQD
ncbi:predicted protein [Naegleria gruberi]|uniref:Predicted protein n=1 Tax=Naegleria gruberi TaxID=5762 RepID=D2VRS2_NAEGR|nr:uncharacterized protein NAEGRDRAFT_71685 [Naegleria gruberi]EFC40512.1 predicted protein [Naegleria gruberi]|eukprot:XP_002673256.1 predicted protein [Naegleria gruberi strain NEG-M]